MADLDDIGGLPGGSTLRSFLQVGHNTDGTLTGTIGDITVSGTGLEAWYSVKDEAFGALGNNTGDDGPAINDAIATASAAGGGVVFFPAGTYRITTELVAATSAAVSLVGVGSGLAAGSTANPRSVLYWPTDLGSGHYAFNASNAYRNNVIQGLKFSGNSSDSPTKGVAAMNMDGIAFGPKMTIRDCVISNGFHAGLVEFGDHAYLENVRSGTGNYYGLYYPGSGSISHGDNQFVHCDFSGCSWASVGVHGDNEMGGDVFVGGHMGFSPYGIIKEDNGSHTYFMDNVRCMGMSIEAIGNCAIYDPTGEAILDSVRFDLCGFTRDITYKYDTDGGMKRGWIDVGNIVDVELDITDLTLLPQYIQGTSGDIWANQSCTGLRIRVASWPTNARPFITGNGVATTNTLTDTKTNAVSRTYRAASSVAVGDVLEIVDDTGIAVQKAVSGSGQPLAGVAKHAASADGYVLASETGALTDSGSTPTADSQISIGDLLTPDGVATAGRVKTVEDADDRVVGVAITGPAGGSKVALKLRGLS